MLLPRYLRTRSSKNNQPKKMYRPCRQSLRTLTATARPARAPNAKPRLVQSLLRMNCEASQAMPNAAKSSAARPRSLRRLAMNRWKCRWSDKKVGPLRSTPREANHHAFRLTRKVDGENRAHFSRSIAGQGKIAFGKILPVLAAQRRAELPDLPVAHEFFSDELERFPRDRLRTNGGKRLGQSGDVVTFAHRSNRISADGTRQGAVARGMGKDRALRLHVG